jgi:hypothetical protein
MSISKERLDELFQEMLANADEDGWCEMPEDLSEDEEVELSKHLLMITMQERFDTIFEGIDDIVSYILKLRDKIDGLDKMDLIKLKSSLGGIKVDAQEILIDLHSDDIVKDFFNLHMIDSMDEKSKMESIKAKKQMISMVGVEFKDDIITMKKHCAELIELVEELHEDIKDK